MVVVHTSPLYSVRTGQCSVLALHWVEISICIYVPHTRQPMHLLRQIRVPDTHCHAETEPRIRLLEVFYGWSVNFINFILDYRVLLCMQSISSDVSKSTKTWNAMSPYGPDQGTCPATLASTHAAKIEAKAWPDCPLSMVYRSVCQSISHYLRNTTFIIITK